ncbi:MAG: DNA repair protein RecO, partial [Acidobacteriota bacterium]|nr:DNA repair protein RecO [Acidobacteriota bacterium]
ADQAEAIVLRTSPIGDQDKLCSFLTRDKGLLRGVAKGARKFGNRFGSSLEPMSHVRVFFYEKERHDLVTVGNADLVESFFDILADLKTSYTLGYFAELTEEFAPARSREETLFRLLLAVLQALRDKGDPNLLARYFEAWLLQINGILPEVGRCKTCRKAVAEAEAAWLSPRRDGVYCGGCAPARKEPVGRELAEFLRWARKNPPPAGPVEAFGPEALRGIQTALQAMIVYHLEREPRTLRYTR